MNRHKTGIPAFFCITIMFLTGSLFAQFSGGSGTYSDPFQIKTAEELNSVRSYLGDGNADKYFKLINDIDLTTYLSAGQPGYNEGKGFIPIGVENNKFTGKFDGNGKKISGLKINRTDLNLTGLFGFSTGTVQNLGIENATVSGRCWNGIICGWNAGTIEACYTNGGITGNDNTVGGLVGQNEGTIRNCYSTATVKGVDYIGGLVGHQMAGTVDKCYATGAVSNTGDANTKGGLIGFSSGTVSNSYWDKNTSGMNSSSGSDPAYGKTTAEMKTQSTYSSWDYSNTWRLTDSENNGYPYLKWQTKFAGGTGTSSDPFLISTADQLNSVRYYMAAGICFKLINDIILPDAYWKPFGKTTSELFYGQFDGDNHAISNLKVSGMNGAGIFNAMASGAKIKNLKIQVAVNDQSWTSIGNIGALAGSSGAEITNCHVTGGQIKGTSTNTYTCGGLVGLNTGLISDCSAANTVRGTRMIGGLVGENQGTITNSSASGSIIGSTFEIGGLVGLNSGTVTNSFASGTVSGASVGGLVGKHQGGIINKCYSTGSVNSTWTTASSGGLIAASSAQVSNCYSTASVTSGGGNTGGLIGYNMANANYCYATGLVTVPSGNIGGLSGYNSGSFTNCYWNKQTTDQSASPGVDPSYGKTTAEMKLQATYSGWDFENETANGTADNWHINSANNGYPHLAWQFYIPVPEVPTVQPAVILTLNSFSVSWSSSATTENYFIDLASDAAFNNLISGYANKDAGLLTSLNISGLTTGSTYYYRVRAQNSGGSSQYSNVITVTIPYFLAGSGTLADPYQITSLEELSNVRNFLGTANSGKYFKLMTDLDCTSYLSASGAGYNGGMFWLPIGDDANRFFGKFDGNKRIIRNLKIDRSKANNIGLFGYLGSGAKVFNLGIEIDPLSSVKGASAVGALAGLNQSEIINCYKDGAVIGSTIVGGLVGGDNGGKITNCYSTGSVTGNFMAGGILGVNNGGIISGCYWDSQTTGQANSAGSDASCAKTTEQMKTKSTYADWDFNGVWRIIENTTYPFQYWNHSSYLSGAFTVGTNGDFTTLTGTNGLFNATNSKTVVSNLTANIISDLTENGATALNQWTESGTGNYTLTILPNNGTLRTISGSAGVNSALIRLNGADRVTIDGQTSKLLTFVNSNPTAGDAGAVLGLDNGSDNCTVTNCNISNSNPASTAVTGVAIGNANGVKISKNKIFGLTGNATATVTGIKYSGTASVLTGTVANNMISLIPTTTGVVSGISYAGNVQNSLNLYYNSIFIGGTQSGSANSYGFLKSSDAANFNIKNNIFHNARTNSTGTGKHYAVALANTVGTIAEDYNLLYSASNLAGLYGSADKSTLANWISDTPYDDNSKSSLISFENEAAGNLAFKRVTANSAVFNTGVAVSGITEDFFGKARPQYGREDMGAHELEQSSGVEENILPIETVLAQNYPNPFNPITAINYELRIADKVKLTIFNAKGEQVKTLVNGAQNAGRYSVNFDGAGFNSGVYFYKLEADGKTMVKRMLMVK